MRVTLLTQYYPPEIGAPQRRLYQLVERLSARGHQITVLTAMPNYPMGEIFDGYGGWFRVDEMDGVRVVRSYIYPTQSAGMAKRMLNYSSFMASSFIAGLAKAPACDYVITESPPLFLGLTGMALARIKNARLIFNVSDLWPESAVRLGMVGPGMALDMSEKLEAMCYDNAWLVSGQSSSILQNIKARFPNTRTYLFSNGVNTTQFNPSFKNGHFNSYVSDPTRPIALYAGLHGLAQGLEQILHAAELDGGSSSAEIFLMGDGPTKQDLMQRAAAANLEHVHFLDPKPAQAMPMWVASADIAIVTLKDFIPGAVPSKIYEAMASGAPILLVASGEAAEIVKKHDAGLVIAPGDVQGLRNALDTLATNPELRKRLGQNGRRAAEAHFDRSVIVDRFIEYMERHLTDMAKSSFYDIAPVQFPTPLLKHVIVPRTA